MTDTMTRERALTSAHWIDAFRSVPREVFVPRFSIGYGTDRRVYEQGDDDYAEATYTDTSLVTQWDTAGAPTSSSSTPSLMARMLEAFTDAGCPVLEIGTGTGYNCALLCHRYGAHQVVSVDVEPALTDRARERLADLGYRPTLITGDGTAGHRERAAYGGILATCGVDRVPSAWLHQVRPGGVIVTNIGNGIAVLVVDNEGGASGGFQHDAAAFMRARPTPEYVAQRAPQYSKLIVNGTGQTRTEPLPHHPDGSDAILRDLVLTDSLEIWLQHHDVLSMSLRPTKDTSIHGLVHPPTGSWARITPADGHTVEVAGEGPRDLWAERIALFNGWIKAGRPTPSAYHLTIDPDGQHTLRRDHDTWTLS